MDVTVLLTALAQKGKAMRDKQIQFFKTRNDTDLAYAKRLEREFDEYLVFLKSRGIDIIPPEPPKQQSLL